MKTVDELQKDYIVGLFWLLSDKLQDRFKGRVVRELIAESISELFYENGIDADVGYDEDRNEIFVQ